MKEYKGNGSGKVIIDGEKIHIQNVFFKEICTFSDIVAITWKEPTYRWPTYANAAIIIHTKKSSPSSIGIDFSYAYHEKSIELYNIIASRIGCSPIAYSDIISEKALNAVEKEKNFYANIVKVVVISIALSSAIALLRSFGII